MNSTEHLEILPIAIPPMPKGKYTHHPISQGQNPDFYRPEDLRDTGTAQTGWVVHFSKLLVGLYWKLGRPVPYAFRTWNGRIRSLDAGCLKFLANRKPAEVSFYCDAAGYIDAVEPGAKLKTSYLPVRATLVSWFALPAEAAGTDST